MVVRQQEDLFEEYVPAKTDGLRVFVWREADRGGATLIKNMSQDIPGIRVIEAPPGVKNVCELKDQCGAGFRDALLELIEGSQVIPSATEEKEEEPSSPECGHPFQGYVDECCPIHSRRRKAARKNGTPDRLTGEVKAQLRYLANSSRSRDAEKHYIKN